MVSDDNGDKNEFDGIDNPSDKHYQTIDGAIIPSHETNNQDKRPEVKKLCRRLKILREVIAYKSDERQYMDQMMLDLSFSEALPMEFCYYQHQDLQSLYKHEERIIRDLGTLGYDASKPAEREREDYQSDQMNEAVDLDEDDDDDSDDIDFIG
jgi:hypothetical protein